MSVQSAHQALAPIQSTHLKVGSSSVIKLIMLVNAVSVIDSHSMNFIVFLLLCCGRALKQAHDSKPCVPPARCLQNAVEFHYICVPILPIVCAPLLKLQGGHIA